MSSIFDPQIISVISIFGEVLFINVVLSGDNAIVVGMAAAGLPPAQRRKALWFGILAATVLRVAFAVVATRLLQIVGLLLAGGILLLWVGWKLWREIRHSDRHAEAEAEALLEGKPIDHVGPQKKFRQAFWQIVVADVSMSLDNILAVAGAAYEHPMILAAGLVASVLIMGLAASAVAKLLERYRWIAYVGLLAIVYVALEMIWRGSHEVIGVVSTVGVP